MRAGEQGTDPNVSVIVAAWNAESFLAAAVGSALDQDGVTVEVIVADDASTDGTAALAAALGAADPRVRLVRSRQNAGPSAARNLGIGAARGDWIAVLDADDRFLPGRLARLVAFAADRRADVVFDMIAEVDAWGRPVARPRAPRINGPERWTLARWMADNDPTASGGTMATGYLKPLVSRAFCLAHGVRYRNELRNSEDYALIAELMAAGASVWADDRVGYLYTRREGSISHRIDPRHLEARLAVERAFEHANRDRLDPETRAALARRVRALEDLLALERIVAELKARRPNRALGLLAARPRALPQLARWIGEVLGKRLARLADR